VKNVSEETFLEVNQEIKNKRAKYDVITIKINFESIVTSGEHRAKLSIIIKFAK
jgi:hypothetical protein